MCGGVVRAAVVGIEAVAGLPLKNKSADMQVGWVTQLDGIVTSLKYNCFARRVADADPGIGLALQVVEKQSAGVSAGMDLNGIAGFDGVYRGRQVRVCLAGAYVEGVLRG